jgi:Second Messenger Oligonucleotide or Dinucleotide Synthetase domain
MGGSGSGGSQYRVEPDVAVRRLREAEEASKDAQTDAEVNSLLNHRLLEVNRRNNEKVSRRLEEIQDALSDQIEGVDRLLFGGSISKQTYVEGLSDVDSLLVLKSDAYGDLAPDQVIEKLQQALESKLDRGQAPRIRPGNLSVTVEYKDGLEVQLLPAVERNGALSIRSATGDRWTTIDPKSFAERLSKVNQSQAGNVVPAIKLAKSILARQPDSQTPTGYHLEALAVAAFENYSGPRNPKAMVTNLFDSAAKNVRSPIADVTGQSGHVDEYLGKADSRARRTMSRGLAAIARRMKNAPNADAWRTLLGDD